MKKICMLLNGAVRHDGRVIKTIRTLSSRATVHLFYIGGAVSDQELFGQNVHLHNVPYDLSPYQKLIRHTYFYKEFDFFVKEALNAGNDYDVVYCNDLPTLNAGVELAKRTDAKLVYDSHEIYTETINQFFPSDATGFKKWIFDSLISFMRRKGRQKEKELVRSVDHFITVNESLAEYFEREYNYEGIEVMMNCPVLRSNPDRCTIDYRGKFRWKDDSVILYYHGVLNEGRGLSLMIDAMARLQFKYKFVIIGYGPIKRALQEQVNRLKLADRVKFMGKVPNHELDSYASSADIGIILLDGLNKSKAWASPNKLFEYIHAGIPSLCTKTLENYKVIEQFKVGALVRNRVNDIVAGIEVLRVYRNNPHFLEEVQRAKGVYSWEQQSGVLKKILN